MKIDKAEVEISPLLLREEEWRKSYSRSVHDVRRGKRERQACKSSALAIVVIG